LIGKRVHNVSRTWKEEPASGHAINEPREQKKGSKPNKITGSNDVYILKNQRRASKGCKRVYKDIMDEEDPENGVVTFTKITKGMFVQRSTGSHVQAPS